MHLSSAFAAIALARSVLAAPYTPSGGLGTNSTPPEYVYMSDFDFQSLNLGLNQEWIELDLFHHALAKFSVEEFEEAGLNAEDRFLLEYMADQEVGHATLIQNMLQGKGAKPCNYTYPFETVREFIDFSIDLTRWGEAGTYGFLSHLNSRPAAALLTQSIATEARQQMVFRQFEGLFPMPTYFQHSITQSMQWTLLAPYLVSCPSDNPHIDWQNFPGLNITNNPSRAPLVNTTEAGKSTLPAITHNRTDPLTKPGDVLHLVWEEPGKKVGYNSSYITNSTAGEAKYAAWISQLNTTYTPLYNISGTSGYTNQPGGNIFGGNSAPTMNATVFVLIVDEDLYVTPFNLTMLNEHVVAGPAMYHAA
ncbi:Rds1 protein [Punctularia strigosozonata HHB-11173 SS5]|uniref:Rds1 protein n=1 Tax=Punctularia strigosozonata (strain HHB-11173) TaxID=741275 RepID=UPI00044173B3|nr:Rds1 protein [Punctularia strigosozonata HHB-11173 SS5]EIN11710.1 Rds1 protein [Punctularia strigosozonata HHB-11173 SS5]